MTTVYLRPWQSWKATATFILIDCPGSHTRLSQVAHSLADTLVTPLNDSFIDFDLLARIDSKGREDPRALLSIPKWSGMRANCALRPGLKAHRLGGSPQPRRHSAHGQQGKDAARD